jgi:hypothetical protein
MLNSLINFPLYTPEIYMHDVYKKYNTDNKILQIAEFSTYTLETQMLDKQKMLSLLEEKYEPVRAKWTTERCAVCRWVEDWEENKMIICNRCQVAVHQECYGVSKSQDLTSWVCRACETPDIERDCCLCPVKGTTAELALFMIFFLILH